MAIALHYVPDEHEVVNALSEARTDLSSRYYRLMLEFMAREPMDSSQYGLGLVELLLAQSQYLSLTQVALEELWRVRGKLVTIALAMGLHRDPVGANLPELDERKRWAWWNVYMLDVYALPFV